MKKLLQKTFGGSKWLAFLLVGIGAGYLIRGGDSGPATDGSATRADEVQEMWTCSMHPQIQKPGPGQCPICGMDLIPVRTRGGKEGVARLVVSPAERERMRLRTVPVERRFAEAEIRMVGKVAYDETRLQYITAWVPGRIDRLYVDYTGVVVREGDHMVYLYSPELFSAQEELLQSARAIADLERSGLEPQRDSARATLAATRDKLRLWGLTEAQIAEIEARGTASEHMTIYSPTGGLVIHKNAQVGMYLETGMRIFTIADLSQVWVMLDAYESDLTWLRFGQDVSFTTEAYPGEEFHGTVSFIDPVLDPVTRTVKVRVISGNEAGRLKPDMFVRAKVRARVAGHGKVMEPSLVGKWVSPMHPEVVKDAAGSCDVCGMDLVPAEELGYVSAEEVDSERPLVIPVSAALVTGRRAIVYVELPDTEEPTYEGREIVLGPRAGDYYIVRQGLEEGDLVVTEGNFKIDSALQIQALPSMMSAKGGGDESQQHGSKLPNASETLPLEPLPQVAAEFREQLTTLLDPYAKIHAGLSGDDFAATRTAAATFDEALDALAPEALAASALARWTPQETRLRSALHALEAGSDLGAQRAGFELLSKAFVQIVRDFGLAAPDGVYLLHCPMAFGGRGADWMQLSKEVKNPYYGSAMLRCGSVIDTLGAEEEEEDGDGR